MSYYDDFSAVNLMNIYINLEEDLRAYGFAYNAKTKEEYDTIRPDIKDANERLFKEYGCGIDFGEAIYDIYAEMGAINQVADKLLEDKEVPQEEFIWNF